MEKIMQYKFEIRKSSIESKGAFAIQSILKGELICCVKGEEISISELKRKYLKGDERSTDPLQISESRFSLT